MVPFVCNIDSSTVHGSPSGTGRLVQSRTPSPWGFALGLCIACGTLAGCAWLPNFTRPSTGESTRLIEQAQSASASGDQPHARQYLERAAKKAPDDPEVQRGVGRVLLAWGDVDEAVKHFRNATRKGVDDPDAYLELAHVLMDAGRYSESQEMVNAALHLVPTHEKAVLLKGRLAELRHDDHRALEIYYQLLENEPCAIEANLRIAEVLMRLDQPNQAAPLLRSVIDASDRVPADALARAHWVLGRIYGRDHRWNDAAVQLAAAAKLRPQLSADEWNLVAYAHWEAGASADAREFLNRALSQNPQHSESLALAAAFRANDSTSQAAYSRPPLPVPSGWETRGTMRTSSQILVPDHH